MLAHEQGGDEASAPDSGSSIVKAEGGLNMAHSRKWMVSETKECILKEKVNRGSCKRSWEYIGV